MCVCVFRNGTAKNACWNTIHGDSDHIARTFRLIYLLELAAGAEVYNCIASVVGMEKASGARLTPSRADGIGCRTSEMLFYNDCE